MKNKIIIAVSLLFLAAHISTAKAQAFSGKGSKYILLGIGISNHKAWYPEDNKGVKGRFSPTSFTFNVQGEFGIHKYIGLGFTAGVTYANSLSYFNGFLSNTIYGNQGYDLSDWRSLGFPIGFIGNFHFLQLIADKTEKSFAEKLDVYAGLSFGAGPSFAIPKAYNNAGGDVGYLLFGGPHVGIRYFPKENFGIYAELGAGKSNGQIGICFGF